MYIPTPIYERIPQCYVLIGLLLITDGLYIGFEFPIAFWYVAVGLMSCLWGFGIFFVRLAANRKRRSGETASFREQARQTSSLGSGMQEIPPRRDYRALEQ